jgi:hypothetical protein
VYTGSRAERRRKALKDTQEYLGVARYIDIQAQYRECLMADPTRKQVRYLIWMLAIAGVRGYPARVFVLHALKYRFFAPEV